VGLSFPPFLDGFEKGGERVVPTRDEKFFQGLILWCSR
jgi:hypothetical protein